MNDLIRRSDAIEALYKYNFVTKEVIEREIRLIPSADRPQGEWIYNGNFCGMNHHKCSVCGRTEFRMSAYCPNCGARMKGADDDRI